MSTVAESTNRRTLKVLVVGQTPPPFSGQAVIIEKILKGHYDGVELIHARMSLSRDLREVGHLNFRKFYELFALAVKIAALRIRTGATVLYYPPHNLSRIAIYRDIFLLVTTRWMFAKTIFHFHASGVSEAYPSFRNGLLRWLYRKAYFGADVGIRSPGTTDDPKFLEARSAVLLRYGIEDEAASRLEASRKAREAEPPAILFVAMLRETKGLLVLLEACAHLRRRAVDFRLLLMGAFIDDEIEARALRVIRENDLEQCVTLLGVLTGEPKHRAYMEAGIFCLPSFFESESAPVVLIDALQFGLPVVGTDWRGIPAMVTDGENGFLVPVHDPIAVADRLETLLKDGQLRRRMGEASRRRYETFYTPAAFRNNLQAVFDSLR